uniref:C-type lectin domain-containing protein n=1 Tax=Dicentrarchus labrax TaxID=13489 RepID=A0A8P4KA25_DICLA
EFLDTHIQQKSLTIVSNSLCLSLLDSEVAPATEPTVEEQEGKSLSGSGLTHLKDEDEPLSGSGEEQAVPGTESTVEEHAESGNGTDGPTNGKHVVVKRATYCPCGWSQHRNRCFRYFSRTLTWAAAQRYCLKLGANLASVHRSSEETFIRKLTNYNRAWIGGSDAQTDGYWLWIDGTRFNYSHWCKGEPNNYLGKQHCLRINWGVSKCWDDGWCNYRHGFVCAGIP